MTRSQAGALPVVRPLRHQRLAGFESGTGLERQSCQGLFGQAPNQPLDQKGNCLFANQTDLVAIQSVRQHR